VRSRLGALALLVASTALGQEKPAEPPPSPKPPDEKAAEKPGAAQETGTPPTFTVGVDVVAVDVNVVDDRGNPYRGLAPEDFKVTVDGHPRRLVTVEYVDLSPDARKERLAPQPAKELEYSTNEGVVSGRLVILVIDRNNIRQGQGRTAIAALRKLLDTLDPNDRVAVIGIPGPSPDVDFTTDHEKAFKAAMSMPGRARFFSARLGLAEAQAVDEHDPFRRQEVLDRECPGLQGPELFMCIRGVEVEAGDLMTEYRLQSAASLHALRSVLNSLKMVEGPKTMILVAEGLGTEDARRTDVTEIRDIANAAASSGTSIYILQLDPSPIDASQQRIVASEPEDRHVHRGGLDTLAGMSRGTVFRIATGAEYAFERIGRELSGYYLLGFEPEEGDRDGRGHGVKVDVARRNVSVRIRERIVIPLADTGRADEEALTASIRSPFLATDLVVRVASYALPDAGTKRVRILASTEVAEARGGIAAAFVLEDKKGKVVGSGLSRIPDSSRDIVRFSSAMVVDPGVYTLRLAVRDRSGRRGSVVHPVKAALVSAGGLELGDLLLGGLGPDTGFQAAARGFAEAGRLTAHIEMQGKDAHHVQQAGVALEISEKDGGPALLSVPMPSSGDGERRASQVTLGLSILPPGDYVARAVVSVDGKKVAGLSRPFRLPPTSRAAAGEVEGQRTGLAGAVARFDVRRTLAPDVVGHFLDRLVALTSGPVSPEVKAAIAQARSGDVAKVGDRLGAREDARVAFLRGLGLLARNQVPGAATQFRAALRQESGLFPVAFYLGATYAATGDDRQAVGAWQTALITETGSSALYELLAEALLRLQEGEQAADIAKEGVESFPQDLELKRQLGIACAMVGRDPEALDVLGPYVESHPEDAGALFVLLRVLFEGFATGGTGERGLDRTRLVHYARAYVDTQGPNREIVAHWLKYLERNAQ
jgi:VWFA-related protein